MILIRVPSKREALGGFLLSFQIDSELAVDEVFKLVSEAIDNLK